MNWFDRFQSAEHERPTVGIILCSEKNDAAARITLPEDNEQILAARYQHHLPTEEELRLEATRSREEVEQRLLLEMDDQMPKTPGRRRTRKRFSFGSKRRVMRRALIRSPGAGR
jgi:hypothetical protein